MNRANVLARDLLYDAPQRDGRAMLRAWGEAVEGASDLWSHLPKGSDVPGTGKEVIDQLGRSARTMHRAAGDARQVDPTLQEIGQVFTQAADLITHNGVTERREPTRWTPAQLHDAFAARVSIMHTLYVASHAVSVGLSQNASAEKSDARLRQNQRTPAQELRLRVLGVEQVAHSYLNGHYPHALNGKHREGVDDARIPSAIGSWDIYAQRALTQAPTTHAMARVAEAAFAASTHVHRLWRVGVETGHIDAREFQMEIAPTLETMIENWDEARTRFKQLTHPHDTSPPQLREAGWELADAMREMTKNPVGAYASAEVARRVDMPSLVRSLHRFHATVAGLGAVFHETARDASLMVSAEAANDMIKDAFDTKDMSPSYAEAVVSPADLRLRRAIPLPDQIRGLVEHLGRQVAVASRASLRATLTASDGKQTGMQVPASWAKPPSATDRLSRSQDLEKRHSSSLPSGQRPNLPR